METIKKAFKYVAGMFFALFVLGFVSMLVIVALVAMLKSAPDEDFSLATIKTEHAVGVAEITGEIFSSEKFAKSIKQLVDNDKIKAIVVRIDSPGGAVGASEEMYRAIKNADAKKPVVCSLGTVAASGGLFAASGCKKIVANESTLTGSIGVIMMSPNVRSLLDRVGVQMTIIKSGRLKDTGSPFREVSPEDRQYLQELLDETHQQFIETVAKGRNIDVAEVKKFADGRIILGTQAKELKLVDEFGGEEEAAKLALSLSGDQSEPEIIKASKPLGFLSMIKEMPQNSLLHWFGSIGKSQLLYQAFL